MKGGAHFFTYLFPLLLLSLKAFPGNVKTGEPQNTIKFTENKNQWDKKIIYRAQLDGGALFLEKNCFTYNFYDKETLRENHIRTQKANSVAPSNQLKTQNSELLTPNIRSHAFRMTFLNAETTVQTQSKDPSHDYCNYFIGNDKSKWVGNVSNFKEVDYKSLYKGIDLQILGLQNSMKYNFVVSPGSNTNSIQLFYEGLENISLQKGALVLKTSVNELTEQHPYAYQWIRGKQVEVACEFVLENNTVHFNFPHGYDKGEELIIDPILIFACSSGSIADNFGMTATYDSHGDLYSGGTVFGNGYPTTLGAYDTSWNGSSTYVAGRTDVVITKYDSSGTFLQYSTYIGGLNGSEIVTSLVVDGQDDLLLYGATGSPDFPTTSTAYDTSFNGGTFLSFVANGTKFSNGTDIYVAKFNATGTSLMASTYIGGSKNDGVNNNNQTVFIPNYNAFEYPLDSLQYNYGDQYRGEINVDKYGNVYISSSTRSSDFPIVRGFDNTLGGQQDAVVFKMNTNLSQLLWSTYLGGTDNDAGYALALDDSANVYVAGGTRSTDFPTTPGALKTSYGGGKADGYITKIKKDGLGILFSTFWGTTAYDQNYFVQLDKKGDVYVVGQTEGAMPVTSGVYNNPNSGQFITKINDSLNTLIFSTVFGNGNGVPNISPAAFLIDYCENIYVSGWGGNIITGDQTFGMPITPNAIQPTSPDGFNFYLFVLSTDAASLVYATYFGGALSREHVDGGTSRFDKKGIIYQSVCAGCGGNDDFPVTPGSWPNTGSNVNHNTQDNNCNNGTFKFDFQVPLAQASFTVSYLSGCAPLTIQFHNQSSTGGTYLWDFGNNDTTSSVFNPIRTYPNAGTFLVRLYVNDPTSCNVADTAYQYVTVHPSINADFDFVTTPCSNLVAFHDSSAVAPVSWHWNFDDGQSSTLQNPLHTYASSGTYNVQLISSTINGCKDTAVVQVNFVGAVPVSVNASKAVCRGSGTQLTATGGFAYSWSPASSLNNATIANPVATPDSTTLYTVHISTINGLGDTCMQVLTTTVIVSDSLPFPLTVTSDHDTIGKGATTAIHAITNTSLSVQWNPASSLNNANSFNPIASPTATTTYTVTVADSSGCEKKGSITIYVISLDCSPADIFVPNTFTPNGDGQNDMLYVRGNEIAKLYFAVYNRWGQLVFETTDLTKGWDGIYKGMKADPAVFAWYIKAKCFNGNELEKKGNVTLIR
jgi:gliding motility-associated-like protein